MNYKYLALSLVMASSMSAINAQEQEACKKPSNIYIGAGIGAMSVLNDGLNSPTLKLVSTLHLYGVYVHKLEQCGKAWKHKKVQDTMISAKSL